jgi:hypothetical protein
MNIFCLSDCPYQSAKWLVDKHVVKQILESCQLLCTAFHLQGVDAPYRSTHKNHPSSIWTRTSKENTQWLIEHSHGISDEYTARYGKTHKSKSVLEWCCDNFKKLTFDSHDLTPFAIAISSDSICRTLPEFNENDPINAYRLYYKHDKKHIHTWKRNKPDWID